MIREKGGRNDFSLCYSFIFFLFSSSFANNPNHLLWFAVVYALIAIVYAIEDHGLRTLPK